MWAVGVPGRRLEFSRTFLFSSPEFSQDLCSSESSPQYLDNAFSSLEISISEDQDSGNTFQNWRKQKKSFRVQQWVFLDQEGEIPKKSRNYINISYSKGGEMKE